MEAALSDVIQFEEALGNITDKPMDSNHLVSVKVDIFEESPYFFKYLHCLNTYEQGCSQKFFYFDDFTWSKELLDRWTFLKQNFCHKKPKVPRH